MSKSREDRIRTCDPLVPNQVRYRPALLPVSAAEAKGVGGLFIYQLPKVTNQESFLPVKNHFRSAASAVEGGEGGIRTRGTELPVRQFSKLLISATHPPHQAELPRFKGVAKIKITGNITQKTC